MQLSSQTRYSAILLSVVFLCLACAGTAKKQPLTADVTSLEALQNQIDAVLQDSALAQTRVGLKIVSLESGDAWYERNSHLLFHPASNMKLLTTAAALARLGPDFRFKTTLHADTAAVRDSLIAGNLYIKGRANPDLSLDDLAWLAKRLQEKGITRINGDLVCDDSYLDDLHWGKGWMWDDASAWYWAPINALTVNDNCVTVKVTAGEQAGDSLRVRLDPPTDYVAIQNAGLTVDSLDSARIRAFKVKRKWKFPENVVAVKGGLPVGADEHTFVIDVVNAALFTGDLFAGALQQAGIRLDGQVVQDTLPDTSAVLVTHFSEPLTDVVINTNKISDNLSAELLLKTLAAEIRQPPGTADGGLSIIKQVLQEAGADTTKMYLADGSGVSRYNVLAPEHLIRLLVAMHRNFRVQAEYKASLPIAAVDGSLRHRMKGTEAEGKLRAKTGSLRGVSTLSGYTTTSAGELLAFSVMMEHFVVKTSEIRGIQDRIGALISGF